MGGNAFDHPAQDGSPALTITRLSSADYHGLKTKIIDILTPYYKIILSPAEAPEKTSHGDVDILVHGPLQPLTPSILASHFNAVRHITNGTTTNFAVPLPRTSPLAVEGSTQLYAQVDIHLCTSPSQIHYLCFLHSNSDLNQLLNAILRPYNLVLTETGLHLRIPAGEKRDYKASRIYLSDSPADICAFLGLDFARYEAGPFESVDEFFGWIVEGRLFRKRALEGRSTTANDRRRMRLRPMFRRFVDEFVPSLPDDEGEGPGVKEEVRDRALEVFEKAEEYTVKVDEIERAEREEITGKAIIEALKGTDMSAANLNLVVRAVKRWVVTEKGALVVREEAEMEPDRQTGLGQLLTSDGVELRHEAVEWLREHWEELKTLEKHRVKEAKRQRQGAGSRDELDGQRDDE